jgi:predicted Zn-dependent protease
MRNDQLISLLQKADNQIEASIERSIASSYSASQTTEIVAISHELVARSRSRLVSVDTLQKHRHAFTGWLCTS